MSFSVAGRTAIVTGAGSGVGRAVARRLLAAGANVMLADAEEPRAEDLDEGEAEGHARGFQCDLRERLALANLLSATLDSFDRVDILVNAAGQVTTCDPLDPGGEAIEEMLRQNLTSALRLSQLAAKRMIKQAAGREERQTGAIVNLSSVAARVTRPELMAYSISCAAVEQMTRALAVALAPERIRVNAVALGSVMSPFLKARLAEDGELRAAILAGTPLGRIAAPDEAAEAVHYLASDGAGFVTGQILTVDGGRSLLDPAGSGGG